MHITKKLLIMGFAAALTACGTVGNAVVSDEDLARKAAFALNVPADQVKISDRNAEVAGTINFVATTKGRKHQCYITSVLGAVNSSAICSGANSVSHCNALQKSAGQC